MITRAQKIRLGIFLLAATVLLLGLLVLVVGTKFMEDWDEYFIEYGVRRRAFALRPTPYALRVPGRSS